MEEDATVYEYDSIYDEMQQKKRESNARLLSGNDDKKVGTWKLMLSVLPPYAWSMVTDYLSSFTKCIFSWDMQVLCSNPQT